MTHKTIGAIVDLRCQYSGIINPIIVEAQQFTRDDDDLERYLSTDSLATDNDIEKINRLGTIVFFNVLRRTTTIISDGFTPAEEMRLLLLCHFLSLYPQYQQYAEQFKGIIVTGEQNCSNEETTKDTTKKLNVEPLTKNQLSRILRSIILSLENKFRK